MSKGNEKSSESADRELLITRTLNAPREQVWEVWTNPEHIKNWWGPTGFTNTMDKMEVKPGSVWEFVMHSPDGTDYKNKNIFKEVVKPERIVFDHVSHPKHLTTVTFTTVGNKTLLTRHMLFESKEQLEQVVKTFKADEGLKQNIDKLEKYLANNLNKPQQRTLTITRIIDAPRELVFKAWIEPKHLAAWWGPKGFTNPLCEVDARPGGAINIDMTGPDGTVYPMGGEFKEIDEPNRLVFTATAFKGEGGKALLENLNTITFEEQNGKTKLTVHVVVMRSEPGTEFALAGMEQGWTESLDRLTEKVKHQPFVIERSYHAPMAKVWSAITDKDAMKQWYFDLAEFKPEVGFEFTFVGGKDGRKFVHLCTVTEVIAGKKLSYSWKYQGYEGSSTVTFELFAEGDKTRLKLTHEGLETFPPISDFAKSNFVAGWTALIGTSLMQFLEKYAG